MKKRNVKKLTIVMSSGKGLMSDEEYLAYRSQCYGEIYLPYENCLPDNDKANLRLKIRNSYPHGVKAMPRAEAKDADPCYQGTALLVYYENVLFGGDERAHDDLYNISGESCTRIPFGIPRLMTQLILTYRQEQTRDTLAAYAPAHRASDSRDLRKYWGFVFHKESKSGNFQYTHVGPDGMPERQYNKTVVYVMITGWQKPNNSASQPYVSLTTGLRKTIRSTARCDLTAQSHHVEFDHRTGAAACARLGIAPAHLTDLSIENGTAGTHFQLLCKSANDAKREYCDQCLHGAYSADNPIPIPAVAADKRDAYLRFVPPESWDDKNNPPCRRCFWGNIAPPEATQGLLEQALAAWREREERG